MPINYQEVKIYKTYNTVNDDIYVGSTTQKLCERISGHRRTIYHPKNTASHYTKHSESMGLITSLLNLLRNVLVMM